MTLDHHVDAQTKHPGFFDVARRGRWIGTLAACLFVAAIFAMLGQWQISRAVEQGQADNRDTETPVALTQIAEPQQTLTSDAGGRMVTVEGKIDAGSLTVLNGRGHDSSDDEGYWVTARMVTDEGSLAVALGWAADHAAADAAATAISDNAPSGSFLGRYVISESPATVDVQQDDHQAMSVAALLNLWPADARGVDVYSGYLITNEPLGGLAAITHAAPVTDTQLNWLNVFYAIEWVVFAVFAFYLWYRLVQDARELEIEAIDEAAEATA